MSPADTITSHFPRLNPLQRKALERLKLQSLRDLLFYLPSHYGHAAPAKTIRTLVVGDFVSVYGRVISAETKKSYRSGIPMGEMLIEDDTERLKVVWFHQAFLAKKVQQGHFVKLTGNVSADKSGRLSMTNPEIEEAAGLEEGAGTLFETHSLTLLPTYPESRGITSLWFRHAIARLLREDLTETLEDPIPLDILERYHLPSIRTALIYIHSPKKASDAEAARKRFAFEEIFFIQLARGIARRDYRANPSYKVTDVRKETFRFGERFGFLLTKAQRRTIETILTDFENDAPMVRLMEGDVGSGKTAVAAATAYAVIANNESRAADQLLQVAYMAPTEILAKQHFASFIEYFQKDGVQIGLLTGSGCYKYPSKVPNESATKISRAQLLKWVENGEVPILFGTHALIQKSVRFKNLAYVIIDEQHRFGVAQRAMLVRKGGRVPHLLSMTATPIPRTLALTIYGDLDLSLLDELPPGRKLVDTSIVPRTKRESVYEAMREMIEQGRQAYIICPRIDEPDPDVEMALQAKSVKAEAKRLAREVFPRASIAILHSKMTSTEKDDIMERFMGHEIDILVATSVVEVGLSVANATMIVIEGAERFGLAQLHQLRGRVQRSSHQPHCWLFTESNSRTSIDRLRALVKASSGFALAEMDLSLRGAGQLGGGKQWGISDIGMEAIRNLKMVEAARSEAKNILETRPNLLTDGPLANRVNGTQKTNHFE